MLVGSKCNCHVTKPQHGGTNQVNIILLSKIVSNKELQSIGRIENIVNVIAPLDQYLGNVKHVQITAETKGRNIKLGKR